MKVNVHGHVLPQEIMNQCGSYGPELYPSEDGDVILRVGDIGPMPVSYADLDTSTMTVEEKRKAAEHRINRVSDPKIRLRDMDRLGIDVMIVTVSPLFYFYSADPEVSIPFAKLQNDALARYCKEAPDRLFFAPTLPLQDIDESLKELERSVGELGGKSPNIACSNINGRNLSDEYFFPLWEKAQELEAPLFVHPEPARFSKDPRPLSPGENLLDYVYQDTVAPLDLMLGGVFDEFPDLRIYLTHGGGVLPYQFARFDTFAKLGGATKHKKPLREYLKNIYVDLLLHDLAARFYCLEFFGVDNIVVGDNFDGIDAADGFAFVDEMNLPPDVKDKILYKNAQALFNL